MSRLPHGKRPITGPELHLAEAFVSNFQPEERADEYPFANLRESIESHSEVLPAILEEFQRLSTKCRSLRDPVLAGNLLRNFCRGLYEAGIIIGIRVAENRHTERPQ